MLHRITMRVLPALTMAVTEEGFRKRKRILMLFPGLIAFALYRGLRVPGWHADIMVLLLASGLFSMLVAMIAYTYGRGRRITQLVQDEGFASLFWIGARFGFLYSLQLSLMVLGLLKVLTYSYSEHPDGPAMMALIISSTSVSRDAFELGHLRRLQQQGRPFLGFPDAKGFWALIMRRTDLWLRPVATGALVAGSAYWMAASGFSWFQSDPGQFLIIGLLAGA